MTEIITVNASSPFAERIFGGEEHREVEIRIQVPTDLNVTCWTKGVKEHDGSSAYIRLFRNDILVEQQSDSNFDTYDLSGISVSYHLQNPATYVFRIERGNKYAREDSFGLLVKVRRV